MISLSEPRHGWGYVRPQIYEPTAGRYQRIFAVGVHEHEGGLVFAVLAEDGTAGWSDQVQGWRDHDFPIGETVGTIVDAELSGDGKEFLNLLLTVDCGDLGERHHSLTVYENQKTSSDKMRVYTEIQLCAPAGLHDAPDLIGTSVKVTVSGNGRISYDRP